MPMPAHTARWQHAEIGDAHRWIQSAVEGFQQTGIRQKCDDLRTLYEGHVEDFGLLGTVFTGAISFNVIQSCCDTLVSHILQNRVRPLFLTDAGNWQLRQMAQGMQRAVEAQFRTGGMWGHLGEDVCSDGIVYGTSGVFVWADTRSMRVKYQRVLPWEIYVSPMESESRHPRTLVYVTRESRAVMLEAYGDDPDAVEAIERAKCSSVDPLLYGSPQDDPLADEITVYRAWHLPSGRVDRDDREAWGYDTEGRRPEANHDGRAVVCIDGATLSDEAYPFDRPPIAFFRPRRRRLGFWGRGVAETLVGHQLEITKTLQKIAAILSLHSKPIVVLWQLAGINPWKFAKSDWARILVSRQPGNQAVQYITPQSIPAELLAHLQRMIDYAYRVSGIPELSAAAVRPPGIESGRALQMIADTGDIRHTPVSKGWEQLHVDLADITVNAYRALNEHAEEAGESFHVIWEGDRELEDINWGEVDLGEMKYRLTTWPVNLLSRTPAARMQGVTDLLQNGLIDREQALEMLDFPDVDAAVDERRAAWKAVQAKVDAAIEGQMEKAIPSPYTNLDLLVRTAIARYQTLEAEDAGEEALDRVRFLIEHARELLLGPEAEGEVEGEDAPPALPDPVPPPVEPSIPPQPPPLAA